MLILTSAFFGFSANAQRPNHSLHFDGNDYVTTSLTSPSQYFAVEAWIKADNVNDFQTIVSKADTSERGWAMGINEGKIYFQVYAGWGNNTTLTGASVSAGVWTHLAMSYADGDFEAYVNGQNVDFTFTASLSTDNDKVEIGRAFSGSYYFKGYIDEVRIWNTNRQPYSTWNRELEGTESFLTAYYKMNDASEPTTLLTDVSCRYEAQDGTISGAYFSTEHPPISQTRTSLSIAGISPDSGKSYHDTTVTITGCNFGKLRGSGYVRFGGTYASSYTSWSNTQIVCQAPSHSVGTVDVVVSNYYNSSTKSSGFTYGPFIETISPTSGPHTGGTTVTLTGKEFGSSGTVQFGGTSASSYTSRSDTRIVCVTPAHQAGAVDVRVSDGYASHTKSSGFTYIPPSISTISPTSGKSSGGTTVTITGQYFGSSQGSGYVQFGGTSASSYTSWSDNQIVCVTPAHAAGTVNVAVMTSNGSSGTKPNAFTYIGPTITSISPTTGLISGGTEVTISGTNFGSQQGSGRATFGGVEPTEYTSWSDTQIVCVTPAHEKGAVDVVVTDNDGSSDTKPAGFTYIGITVTCITPYEGETSGGTEVTIDGIYFGDGRGSGNVTFGGLEATSYTSWSDTQIVCVTPAHEEGMASVVVTNDDGKSDTAEFFYGSWQPDAHGYTLDFDGNGDYVEVPNASALIANSSTMTISGWIYPTNSSGAWPDYDGFFGFRNDSNADFHLVQLGLEILGRFKNSSGAYFDVTTTKLIINQWQHIALTYDGSTLRMYHNGAEVDSISANGVISNPNEPFRIGRIVYASWNFDLTGQVDEVRIWNTARTQSDITANMNNELTGNESGLVAYYKMSNGSGTTLSDDSGNNHNGTISGAAWVTSTGPPYGQLLTTPGGETGDMSDWTIIENGGDGWLVSEEQGEPHTGNNFFATSHGWCKRSQTVDLIAKGYSEGVLDSAPTVNVSEWFKEICSPDNYYLKVELRDAGGGVIASFDTGVQTTPGSGDTYDDDNWFEVTHSFSDYGPGLRFIYWEDGGDDSEGWAGHYGTSLDDAFLEIGRPTISGPKITCLSPYEGLTSGGTEVTIDGINFGSERGTGNVTFDGMEATITSWSDTEIICTTPAHAVGGVLVVITTGGGDSDTSVFVYSDAGITSISPIGGLISGGTEVTISGYKFGSEQGSGGVTFGEVAATEYTSWSDTEIVCKTPAHDEGPVDVVVTTNDGDSYTKSAGFTYIGPPEITSIVPAGGTTLGGTSVTINGTNFGSEIPPNPPSPKGGTGSVTFGGLEPTEYTSWSDTKIVCKTPAHDAGAVDVVVTEKFGLFSDTESGGYLYTIPPEITSVTPIGGTTVGGTSVTIIGTNFGSPQGSGGVLFGGVAATSYTNWSDTEIVCVMPAHAEGLVDVVVTEKNGFVTDTKTDGFLYIKPPGITSISPAGGTTIGGTSVTITGTNLGSEKGSSGSVTFGGVEPTEYTSWSDTEIVYVTPAHTEELVDVVVTEKNGLLSDTKTDGYRYVEPPKIASVSPVRGQSAGGSTVTIGGTNFGEERGSGSLILGGTEAASYTSWSDTEIVCKTPAHEEGWVDVVVTEMYGFVSDTKTDGFVFINPPKIDPINPKPIVTTKGGTQITITGKDFGHHTSESDKLPFAGSITFGGAEGTIVNWAETEIVCTTPALAQGGIVGVKVTERYGFLSDDEPDAYVYLAPVEIILSNEEKVRWRIVGPPVTPPNPDGDTLFDPPHPDSWGVLLVDWTVARWNEKDYRYERPNGLTQRGVGNGLEEHASEFLPGTGWWIAKANCNGNGVDEDKCPEGAGDECVDKCVWEIPSGTLTTYIDGSTTHSIDLKAGWNMIANPFPFNRAWNTDGITLTYTKGGQPYTDQPIADASACTDGKIYWYDGEAANYPSGISYNDGHIMGPWYGYCIKVEDDVTDVTLKITSKATKEDAPIYPASDDSVALDWQIKITASMEYPNSGESGYPTIIAGICEESEPYGDMLDDRQPLESPDGTPLIINFDNSDWPFWNGTYRQDMRPEDSLLVYPINIEVPTFGQAVTLDFDFTSVPDDYCIWLYDKESENLIKFPLNTQSPKSPLPPLSQRGAGGIYQLSFWPLTQITAFDLVVSSLSKGDIDCDGEISSADVSMILRSSVEPDNLSTAQLILGDVTENSAVSAYDAAVILNDTTPVLTTEIVTVSIPVDLSTTPGATGVLVPVNVTSVTDLGIISADIVLEYDTNVLTATGTTLDETIAVGGQVETYIDLPASSGQAGDANGKINIGLIKTNPALSGEGVLVYILFDVKPSRVARVASVPDRGDWGGSPTATSELSLSKVEFNEGLVKASVKDGKISINYLTVTGISPSRGPVSGGTPVTITGENFVDTATVKIGGSDATDVTIVSSTEITARTPAGVEGTADVVVSNENQSSTLKDGFTYVSDDTLIHQVITAGEAYRLNLFNSTLIIPAGAIVTGGTLEVEILENTAPLLGGVHDTSLTYNLHFIEDAPNSCELGSPLTLIYHYQEDILPQDVSEEQLRVYREKSSLWYFVGGVVDAQEDTVTVEIDRFSTYSLLAGYAYGDVSGNGSISSFDSALVMQKSVGLIGTLPPPDQPAFQLQTGDVSGNGAISSFDSALILRKGVGLPPHPSYPDRYAFPVENPPQVVASPMTAKAQEVVVDTERVGEEIHIHLLLDNAQGIFAVSFQASYAPGAFRFVSAETPPLSEEACKNIHSTDGALQIGVADVNEVQGFGKDEPLLTIRMRQPQAGMPAQAGKDSSNLSRMLNTIKIQLNEGQIPVKLTILPTETKLLPNYPNPFNPETWIPYTLTEEAPVTIEIYNVSGQLVRRLNLGVKERGNYVSKGKAAYWDGRTNSGERVASGIYFYTLKIPSQSGDFAETRKMVMMK